MSTFSSLSAAPVRSVAGPRLTGYWIALTILVVDQATKYLVHTYTPYGWSQPVTSFFNLVHAWNYGAAFSFLAHAGGWQRWFFLGLGAAVSIGLIVWLGRLKPEEKWLAAALALILGGAVGNLIDRAWLGQVIDFIQLYYDQWYWPAFNIADSAITVGAALLVLDSLWSRNAGDLKHPAGDA